MEGMWSVMAGPWRICEEPWPVNGGSMEGPWRVCGESMAPRMYFIGETMARAMEAAWRVHGASVESVTEGP